MISFFFPVEFPNFLPMKTDDITSCVSVTQQRHDLPH